MASRSCVSFRSSFHDAFDSDSDDCFFNTVKSKRFPL